MTPGHHTRLDLLLEYRRPSGADNVRSVTRRARPPDTGAGLHPAPSSFVLVEGRKAKAMSGLGKGSLRLLTAGLLAAGCGPGAPAPAPTTFPSSARASPPTPPPSH